MKGQYLAVEAVMTAGIGLIILFGTIAVFSSLQGHVSDEAETQELEYIQNQLVFAVVGLEEAEVGRVRLELPENIGGSDYRIAMTDGKARVIWNRQNESVAFSELSYTHDFTGAATGGDVEVVKTQDTYSIIEG